MNSNLSFRPRDGHTLRAIVFCRVSSDKQDERSIEDQLSLVKRFVDKHYGGKVEYTPLQSEAPGELLDRQELRDAEDLIARRRFDLVMAEDISRISRRHGYVFRFCEECEDFDTRVFTVDGKLDTARSDWRMSAVFEGMRHEMYNQDLSGRLRRTFQGRFPNGEILSGLPYGFVKPPGAKCDKLLRKDPDAEPIVGEVFRRAEAGATFAEIAAWLNEQQVPVGPRVRGGTWTAGLVGRLVRNPIYKGVRHWNRRIVKRNNRTGKRHAVKADPDLLLTRECPHLAFIDPDRFDRLQRQLQERNGKYSRAKNGADPRANVPKKATCWPGGHAECYVCKRPLYWGGHGRMDRLLCSGCRKHRCWNSCTFDGKLGAEAILRAVLKEAAALPEFDDDLTTRLRRELEEEANGRDRRRAQLDREIKALQGKIANVEDAIADGAKFGNLRAKAEALEASLQRAKDERVLLDLQPRSTPPLPGRDELRRLAEEALREPPLESGEFQRMMKALLPRLRLAPYRLCNDGKVVPRAKVVVDFLALSPAHKALWNGVPSYRKKLVVDLFKPSQHVRIREELVRLRAEGKTEREAAAILGVAVQTAQRAAAIQRAMDEQGLTDPWVEIKKEPDDIGKMRSHRNKLYKFEPLEGFMPLD